MLKYGLQYFSMGDAAAVSVVMFGLIMAITLVQRYFVKVLTVGAVKG